MPGRLAVVLAGLLVAVAGACGSDDETPPQTREATTTTRETGPCDAPVAESLDPHSGRHVLPGAEPTYQSDPPTSGPHRTGSFPTGVLPDPIDKPVQVAMLERGDVLIQHAEIEQSEFDRLAALAGDKVSVAPNPSLPSRIVATAWQYKLVCRSLDETSLRAFIDAHVGKTDGSH